MPRLVPANGSGDHDKNGGRSDRIYARTGFVRYMHRISTHWNALRSCDLRLGASIFYRHYLLREGLDIPECALVAILDADKGFAPETAAQTFAARREC